MRYTSKWMGIVCALAGLLLCGGVARAATVQTKMIAEGVAGRMAGIRPRPLDMLRPKPDGIQKLPEGIAAPLYGVLTLGPVEKPTRFVTVMDELGEGEPRIWLDTNANGDLTDDAPLKWKKSTYKAFNGMQLALYQSSITVQVKYGEQTLPLHLNLLRYDPRDPNREGYRNTLLYMADYARETELQLGANAYHALLYDTLSTGDFRGRREQANSGVYLFLDVNGNGQFDARGEIYDAAQPFTIKGVTYEIANMLPDGSAFDVVKSKRSVPEILPPPDLRVGKPVLPFEKKLLDGKTVHFPADYKGKLVLLYFWASYCPDCQAEIPAARNAYKQFHDKGIDFLGVSVDPGPEILPMPLKKYVEASHMPWPQVYEGKLMQGDVAQLYFLNAIPTPYLVDGTTGLILAAGDDLKGPRLAETLQKALTAKKP